MLNKGSLLLFATLLSISTASVLLGKVHPFFQEDLTSCAGRCNVSGTIPNAPCQCNTACIRYGDCCADYNTLCLGQGEQGSCVGRCDQSASPDFPCQCNKPCVNFGDCCPDYEEVCQETGGPITIGELEALSEELFSLESANNVYQFITVNLTGKILLAVDPRAYETPTISKFVAMLDNYIPEVSKPEAVTAEELAEEQAFLDAIFDTPVMKRAQEFLVEKGLPSGRESFYEIWFGLYSRSGSTLGSSGFEHIFLAELKSGVSGFHNWVHFAKEEAKGNVIYKETFDTVDLGAKGMIVEFSFNWLGQNKPVSSMYIGTSPELELALNTVSFYARRNAKCPVQLNNNKFNIQTYDINSKFVASGYPDLSD